MKNKLIAFSLVTVAAIAHVGPSAGLIMIACGDEVTRALGAVALFATSFVCGYFHGLNRTFGNL